MKKKPKAKKAKPASKKKPAARKARPAKSAPPLVTPGEIVSYVSPGQGSFPAIVVRGFGDGAADLVVFGLRQEAAGLSYGVQHDELGAHNCWHFR